MSFFASPCVTALMAPLCIHDRGPHFWQWVLLRGQTRGLQEDGLAGGREDERHETRPQVREMRRYFLLVLQGTRVP